MNKLALRRTLTGSLVFSLLACGGTTFAVPGDDAGQDSAPGRDAGSSHDGSPARDAAGADAKHPTDSKVGSPDTTEPADAATPPDGGSDAADDAGGSDDAGDAGDAGHDATVPPIDGGKPADAGHDSGPAHDAGVDAPIGVGCPTTPPSGSCVIPDQRCEYPSEICICSSGELPGPNVMWQCSTLPAGCPDPQPTIGQACTQPGLTCDYGMCMGGESFTCSASSKWAHAGGACPG